MKPAIEPIEVPSLSSYKTRTIHLSNGIPVHFFEGGTQPVLKLDVVIHASRYDEAEKLTLRTVASLLKEGTESYTSQEIAEELDFYGVGLKTPILMDTLQYSIFTLTKNLESVVPVLRSMFTEPTFPEAELEIFKQRCIQQFQIDIQKNEVVAFREFTSKLFGDDHPYGYNSTVELYKAIDRKSLLAFYNKYFTANHIELVVSGHIDTETIEQLETIFGGLHKKEDRTVYPLLNPIQYKGSHHINVPDSHQVALRIGKPTIPKSHKDAPDVYITNIILGGYFGSRLMHNIREEKGYTYGIYAQLEQMKYGAYWTIACELDEKYVKPTLVEIEKEITLLATEPMLDEELKMVKNYLRGTLLQYLDGSMKASEMFVELISEGIDIRYFDALVERIETITAEDIRATAEQYFLHGPILEVVVS